MWNFINFLLLIVISAILCDEEPILVHVLFRHGDRTPDLDSTYPNDPYKNETYYPYGFGQLTNAGKLREYKLGQYLRQRYDGFLDDIYTPDLIDSRSSDYKRTKMSLELVLAGLFPPKDQQIWLNGLNWQPIPYTYFPLVKDEILMGIKCPNFKRYLNEYEKTAEYGEKFAKNRHIFQYIEEHSGLNNLTFQRALELYFCLETEYEYGFALPQWAQIIYPELLKNVGLDTYDVLAGTTLLKTLSSGYLIKKIVDDTVAKLNGTLVPQMRKIFLYSAHEVTIALLSRTLGSRINEIPPYGSSIIFEVHQIDGVYGFKIYYENNLDEAPILFNLPNCGEFCPVDKFIELYQQYFDDGRLCYN